MALQKIPLPEDDTSSPLQLMGGPPNLPAPVAPVVTAAPTPASNAIPRIGDDTPLGRFAQPILPAPPPPPSAETFGQADRDTERSRLQTDRSELLKPHLGQPGSAHPGWGGKILHGLAEAGNVAGEIVDPGAMARIRGTDANNEIRLNNDNRGIDALDKEDQADENALSENMQRDATTAETQANTAGLPQKQADAHDLTGATVGNLESETNTRNNPAAKFENTPSGPMMIRPDGTAQHVTVDGKPIGPAVKLSYQTVDAPDGPHVYGVDEQGNKVVDLGKHYERPAVSVNAGEKNLWSVPQPDGTQKVVSLRAGDTIPKGAVSLSGQNSENLKGGAADAPTEAALKYANDYLASGAFTGPSDEALQDQFFQMAKPSTGFRMNQAQIDQLHHMASWMDSMRGRLYHTMNGVWFAPNQRSQIVKTMNDLARSKGIANPTAQGGGQGEPVVQHSPSTGQYRYSTDGGKTWQQGKPPSK